MFQGSRQFKIFCHVKLVVVWDPCPNIVRKESSNCVNKRIAVLPPSGVQVAGLEPSQEAPGRLASGRRAEIFPNIASHLFAAQPANILKLWQGQNLEGLHAGRLHPVRDDHLLVFFFLEGGGLEMVKAPSGGRRPTACLILFLSHVA